MKRLILSLIMFFPITILNSCIDECEGLGTDQLLRFGEYQIKIDSGGDTLLIGDSIRFSIKLPRALYDSISMTQMEIEDIEIGFYVTRDTDEP